VGGGPKEFGYLWGFEGAIGEEFVLGVAITTVVEDVVGLELVIHICRLGVGDRRLVLGMILR